MSALAKYLVLACGIGGVGWAARCTTTMAPAVLREYTEYVAAAEQAMSSRFDSGELAWVPAPEAKPAAAQPGSRPPGSLEPERRGPQSPAGRAERHGDPLDRGYPAFTARAWPTVKSVLEDYDHYARIYRPMVFESKALRDGDGPRAAYDVNLGLQSAFRFASVFPQHYAFHVKGRIEDTSAASLPEPAVLRVHLAASEIRESDSGVPGRTDFLEPYHDHGIMWALNAYWRARRQGDDLYLEFETITLARSVEEFACKIGFVPVPKAVVSAAMDSLPADCVTVILEGTRAECERRTRLNGSSH